MEFYKFKLAPADAHFQIPFDLTEKGLSQWLKSFENKLESEKPQQILLAIQALNKDKSLPAARKSLLLEKIYSALPVYLEPLKVSILNSALPLSDEEQSNIQSIVWIYAELANGFASCITKKSNLANTQTLFYGLQSLVIAYLNICKVYQQPYPNFWKQSYLFYGLGCKLGIENQIITQYGLHSDTISKTFKHLLALYHCGLEQFRPREILTVSTCIERKTSLMLIDKVINNNIVAQYSGFDINTDTPPTALARLKKTEKSALRFFSAYNVASQISKNAHQEVTGTGILKSINHEVILQAAKTLSLSQRRKFTRFNDQQEKKGIIGLKHIIEELGKTCTLTPAEKPRKSIKQTTERWNSPELELVTEGYESLDVMKSKLGDSDLFTGKQNQLNQAKQVFKANNNIYKHDNNIWTTVTVSEQQKKPSLSDADLDISDSSIKGYKIIFNTDDKTSRLQIGDIIGIKNKVALEIGIIHRITQLTEHKLTLGINLLALESELSYISLPKHESIYSWAIFLPGIKALKSADSIIFNDSKFQSGEFIKLHRSGQEAAACRLSKLLHISGAATHIELFDSSVMNEV